MLGSHANRQDGSKQCSLKIKIVLGHKLGDKAAAQLQTERQMVFLWCTVLCVLHCRFVYACVYVLLLCVCVSVMCVSKNKSTSLTFS